MSFSRKTSADLLFLVQILGALAFTGSQYERVLSDVHGVSVVQFALATAFAGFNLLLAIGAHRAQASRITRQQIATYCIWVITLFAVVLATWLNPDYRWSIQDTVTLLVTLVLVLATLAFMRVLQKSVRDPMSLAFLAISSKAVPQLLLVWKVLEEGGSGIPLTALLVGHMTILIRLIQIYLSVREAGWERNRRWLAISETAALLTWLAVTVAWLVTL